HQPITYMIAFSPDHAVRAIEVLVYRESYGYEVRRESFRRQFYGTGPEEPIRLNAEIRNITGATISCRSIIRAVTVERAYVSTLLPKAEAPKSDLAPAKESALAPRDAAGPYRRRARVLMGATLDIQAYASDAAIDAAFAEVARLEALLSDWREDTPVARLNREGEAAVGAETAALLARSKVLARESLGAFDVTARPLVALWREAEARGAPPEAEAIEAARKLVGAEGLRLSEEGAVLASAGMSVDLGGVGKGYALDRAAAVLRERGVDSALLNFGGQLLALGPPPGRKGWPVEVRDPRSEGRALASFALARGSAATSSDEERGLTIAGRRVSHILDPRT
ncbi:MAG: FAD:protein FMN transferase, partial [Candidatus Methylomirabilis sp.]|nr:FAD:protein FMN transferase [Deltaproteobacteria bacterium]